MKVQVAVSFCVLAIISAAFFFSSTSVRRPVPLEVAEAYSRWVQEFGKLYATPAERDYRLSVFYDQWVSVEQSNQEYELAAAAAGQTLTGPMFAINGFSDLTIEEFGARYTGLQLPEELEVFEEDQSPAETQGLAASNLGAGYSIVIKSQGGCGSCWAFSAVAALEKYYYDKQKTRVDLSQQELVDCDSSSSGCSGGRVDTAFTYVSKNGLAPASKYPYRGSKGSCQKTSSPVKVGNSAGRFAGFSQKGAISAAAKGVHAGVSVYAKGKFHTLSNSKDPYDPKLLNECNQKTDHALNLFSASGDTLRVFNSWGTRWAENGYKTIKICGENNLIGSAGAMLVLP